MPSSDLSLGTGCWARCEALEPLPCGQILARGEIAERIEGVGGALQRSRGDAGDASQAVVALGGLAADLHALDLPVGKPRIGL
jgi:hypothetical protein